MNPYLGLLGILVLIALCYLLSYNPRRVSVRMIAGGVGLQFAVAWALLRFPPLSAAFDFAASVFNRIISFAEPGSRFLFGELVGVREPWLPKSPAPKNGPKSSGNRVNTSTAYMLVQPHQCPRQSTMLKATRRPPPSALTAVVMSVRMACAVRPWRPMTRETSGRATSK